MLYYFIPSVCHFAELLKQILKEVKSSNRRVADLEKQLKEIQGEGTSRQCKKTKPAPSPEIRVNPMHATCIGILIMLQLM